MRLDTVGSDVHQTGTALTLSDLQLASSIGGEHPGSLCNGLRIRRGFCALKAMAPVIEESAGAKGVLDER